MERETKKNIWLTDLKYEKYCIIIILPVATATFI